MDSQANPGVVETAASPTSGRAQRAGPLLRDMPLRLAGLESIVGLHLGICHSKLVQKLDPVLRPLGLTAKQVTILWLADANPDITQIEIARFLHIERATIHQFTRSLVGNGLVVIEPSRSDGRATRMRLTELGVAKLEEAQDVIVQYEAEAKSALSAAEQQTLLDLLMKLHGFQSGN